MKIAIHHHLNQHNDSFSYRWIDLLEYKGIEVDKIDFRDTDIIDKLKGCDGAMWHWFHFPDDKQAAPKILDSIEYGLKIPVFPNKETRWHYDEKVGQHYLLDTINVPRIKSWVFWIKQDALNFAETARYPVVFKLSVGAGSANVLKVNNKDEAVKLIELMFGDGFVPYSINEFEQKKEMIFPSFYHRLKDSVNYMIKRRLPNVCVKPESHWYYLKQKNYVYFQKYIPGNPYDIRVTIIGNRAFAFVRFNRDNDFRASGSGKINYEHQYIPTKAIMQAFQISKKCNFQSMAYDFLKAPDGRILLNEISYCYQNKAVYECGGYWTDQLDWVAGHIWPEEAIMEDFINSIRSKK